MRLDGGREQREAIAALDAWWESFLAGATPLDGAAEHDALRTTVERLYARDDTPRVDPAFVRALEGRLMDRAQTASPAGFIAVAPVRGLRWWRRPSGQDESRAEPGRRAVGSLVATAALLLITLAAGLVAIRWYGGESGPTGSHLISPPVGSPTAAECDMPPRTGPPAPIGGTPVPSPLTASRVLQDTRLWLEEADLPEGAPASADEVVGIAATIGDYAACEVLAAEAATDLPAVWDARARQFALFTDDYLRRHREPVPASAPGPGTPASPWWGDHWSSAAWTTDGQQPEIVETVRLPNDRVGALLATDRFGSRDFVVFVRGGDRWLIDEIATVAPEATPSGTPSAQEIARSGPTLALLLADIVYAPSQLGIPPDTRVALTLANVGQVRHTFNIDALGIHVELLLGESKTISIDAPAGIYEFYCSVPGHREAGMVGSLLVDPAYRLPVVLVMPPGNVLATEMPESASPPPAA
ncbi:MAG TPA: cupredoxin domain-containing protein [Thermomicrobiales bacterium]|jgi:plastocyanin